MEKRIGDWIDIDALKELKRDENCLRLQRLEHETFLNNLEQRLCQLSQELEFIKMLVARYKSDNLSR